MNQFIIDGPGLTEPLDLPPPPTVEIRRYVKTKKSPDGTVWFATDGTCYTDNPDTELPKLYIVRFASSRNSGWVTLDVATRLWEWFEANATFTITTNLTIPPFTNRNVRFYYEGGGKPLTLVRAGVDTTYWRYDMTLFVS